MELHLSKTSDSDTVEVSIRTDYTDPETAIVKTNYTFNGNESGWQTIQFEKPATVIPGKTYYLVVQATKDSGRVVWNGTTENCGSLNSISYDLPNWGGWAEKPYYPAFEILSYSAATVAQGFEARGSSLRAVDLTILSQSGKGTITAEIRTNYGTHFNIFSLAVAKAW